MSASKTESNPTPGADPRRAWSGRVDAPAETTIRRAGPHTLPDAASQPAMAATGGGHRAGQGRLNGSVEVRDESACALPVPRIADELLVQPCLLAA
jgi:hypothetical protein